MNLLHVYNLLNTGEITEEEAAATYGFTVQNLRFRISRHGSKLPFMLATLDKIKSDQISRIQAAKLLECSVRQVNKMMESWSIVRPFHETRNYLVKRATSEVKWEVRKKYAIDFIEGTINFDMAAEAAQCDTRTMRRWVTDLLKKHYEMPYKDLARVELPKRRRLAQEIRVAENLEKSTQKVADAIADGQMSMKDEAIKRVKEVRLNKRGITSGT